MEEARELVTVIRTVLARGPVLGAGVVSVAVAALACRPADVPPSSSGVACGRGLAICELVEGRAIQVTGVPADLRPEPEQVETHGDERRLTRTFRSAARPWLGPGGPIGRELTVIVVRHEAQSRSAQLDVRVLPASRIESVGGAPVLVSERPMPARRADGAPTDVPASELVAAVNDRVTVLAIGHGLTVAELRDLAPGIEVR
jgi:hypothetical protein